MTEQCLLWVVDMNLLQMKALSKFEEDLTELLKRCHTRDSIVTHFSQYLQGAMTKNYIEDYDFYPELTSTETIVKVHVFFQWDLTARNEIVIKKNDSPKAAYNRAMGIV